MSGFPWRQKRVLTILGVVIVVVAGVYVLFLRPPASFPRASVLAIDQGQTLSSVADLLQEQHFIRSKFWFVNAVVGFSGEQEVVQGDYYFPTPENAITIAWRIAHADYETSQTRTTIPEGSTVVQISLIVKKNYPDFDDIDFLTLAAAKEGYLFPDTYYFGASTTPQAVLTTMTSTFNEKISQQSVAKAITAFGQPLPAVITMASILEHEAYTMKDRQIIAGILWKRLSLGMPLDLDSTLYYITGKDSAQLTKKDLALQSPYNTYLNKGLPPTPIGNPGLDDIMAAVTPTQTNYLYFLNDANGTMHYAVTLVQQNANEAKYLN